jgi:hypothetical protein
MSIDFIDRRSTYGFSGEDSLVSVFRWAIAVLAMHMDATRTN